MRIVILSDIHANIVALEAVIADARQHRVDTYWFLGDLFGYGPRPKECFWALQDIGVMLGAWITGNHDYALSLVTQLFPLLVAGERYRHLDELDEKRAKTVCDLVKDRDAQEVLLKHAPILNAWFKDQKDDFCSRYPAWNSVLLGIYLAHGTIKAAPYEPENLLGYLLVQDEQSMRNGFKRVQENDGTLPQLLIVGHSHLPAFWRCNVSGKIDDTWGKTLHWKVEADKRQNNQSALFLYNTEEGIVLGDLRQRPVVINPGSVGQPRDHDPRAAYAILDLNQRHVSFRRVEYDVLAVQKDMRERGYPLKLIERLALGR
jgi:predicted phosphodiesterase